ncbi:hypothetical protein [Streptomyces sp. cmx-18-6]|uniref:hypothetical protein n=1 Tax=Streptomyces sp. cmx-18-6 TaxID=2790930 RepID=UPI0039803B56
MGGLISELGKKIAEKWFSLLVLPGALFLAVVVTAHSLGHVHALDVARLTDQIAQWARRPAVTTVPGQIILLAAVLAGASAVGLAAQAIGSVIERLRLAADWESWPLPLRRSAARLVTRRQRRWRAAALDWHGHRDRAARARAEGRRADPADRRLARRKMVGIAPEYPGRPTWSGDQLHAVTIRLERESGLGLDVVWPYLWLILPETVRGEISAARENLARSADLLAWATLYLLVGGLWWPAVLISAGLTVAGWRRGREYADTYSLLLTAATRLHARELAERLGIESTGPFSADAGDSLTHWLRNDPPPVPPVVA